MSEKGYLFDRRIWVTLAPIYTSKEKSLSFNLSEEAVLNIPGSITIAYDPIKYPTANTRIDFNVMMSGIPEQNGKSLAQIDMYNLGDDIRTFLDAYNDFQGDDTASLNINKRWAVILKVGFVSGQPLTTIFSGFVSSFNMERQQTEDSVDEVWHLYCTNIPNVIGLITNEQNLKMSNRLEFSDVLNLTPEKDIVLSWEDYLYKIIQKAEKEIRIDDIVIENKKQTKQELSKHTTNSSFLNFVDGYFKDDSLPRELVSAEIKNKDLNEIKKNYKIVYASRIDYKEDEDLKRKWKTKGENKFTIKSKSLDEALCFFAKKVDNCNCSIRRDARNNKTYIFIYKAGKSVPKYTNSEKWIIKNFQNVIGQPKIDDNKLTLDLILEPNIQTFDSVSLEIDDSFSNNVSFDLTGNSKYDYGTFTNVGKTAGIGMAKSYDPASAKKYGNIFYKYYCIFNLTHSGSSHENTWQTSLECTLIGN